MLSREDLAGFADAPPRLVPPRVPLTTDQSSALNAALRAFDHICRAGEDGDGEPEARASLIEQLAVGGARRAALVPAIDDAMTAQEALATAGLELLVQGPEGQRRLTVSRRWTMAPRVALERDTAE